VLKILIVDDMKDKREFLKLFIKENCLPCEFFFACSYEQAIGHLKTRYDLAVVDHFLRFIPLDGKKERYGSDFALEYSRIWPECLVLPYSSDPELAAMSIETGMECFSFDSVPLEIVKAIGDFNNRRGANSMVETKGDVYSKELCNTIHLRVDEKQAEITQILGGIHLDIKEFSNSNRRHNRQLLGSLIIIVLTQIAVKIF